ncbi:hypothetical protein SAMN04488066_104207 [Halorubrum aquaticum]|uniref:Uncharacterized protein n=1 Tax=Halorubrum aquaticum TaxID=387340 RepID=A0A1I3A758_9EURY|nr:hypothetical protein SAMN04488066_104207 [Halorubrum aquaticum]
MVEIEGKRLITHCFGQLIGFGADDFIVVVGYLKEEIIDRYGVCDTNQCGEITDVVESDAQYVDDESYSGYIRETQRSLC